MSHEALHDAEDFEDNNNDVVLSRQEYELLKAFHKLIPVPAIASGITRIICEEELQVRDELIATPGPEVDDTPETGGSAAHVSIVRRLSRSTTPVLRQASPKAAKLVKKEYDLTKFTPRQPPRPPKDS
ncbi:hypothetical protein ACHHYP_07592 [Achlya hypogyna]|uniref:Uncharacterized protein n=1 Tax=Achlya hypogyna TaxID=1202772 RepID=A0A1V9ZLT2_ACHHY|nr:hypothetical protein ACHHYP_07592 [Achlya hypogyna]